MLERGIPEVDRTIRTLMENGIPEEKEGSLEE